MKINYDKIMSEHMEDDIVFRLIKRAQIRRQIPDRKSVQEGTPDRIADILEEASIHIYYLRKCIENGNTSTRQMADSAN